MKRRNLNARNICIKYVQTCCFFFQPIPNDIGAYKLRQKNTWEKKKRDQHTILQLAGDKRTNQMCLHTKQNMKFIQEIFKFLWPGIFFLNQVKIHCGDSGSPHTHTHARTSYTRVPLQVQNIMKLDIILMKFHIFLLGSSRQMIFC